MKCVSLVDHFVQHLVQHLVAGCAMLLIGMATCGNAANLPTRGEGVSDDLVQTFRDRNGSLFEGWPKPQAVINR